MSRLVVLACGAGTSLQDDGRFGYQRFGVGPAGAMDREAFLLANALVGNEAHVAAIEFTLMGGKFRVEGGRCRVALMGAEASLAIDDQIVPPLTSATAEEGQTITVASARAGVSMLLAVAGGFDLPPDLGSLSYHKRAGLGGYLRRNLQAGDALPLAADHVSGPEQRLPALPKADDGPYRVVLGPQDDYISAAGIRTFLQESYEISAEADRMGFRLTGPKIEHELGYNIVSDGIVTGSVQVPGTGEPIILLADRQTTGGYPKIATVISSDLSRLVQQRPGSKLRFTAISRDEAVALARHKAAERARLIASLVPVTSGFDSERLLSLQLIDGFIAD